MERLDLPRKHKAWYFVLGVILSISITIIRYITGPAFQIGQFYIIPIIVVTWYIGRNSGVIIATISILLWIIFDFFTLQSLAQGLAPGLNEIFRLLIYIFIIQIVHKLRTLLIHLQEMSGTDPLTRINNRRAFFKGAERELERASRYGHLLSLIFIDLDNFKTVNDTLGHIEGDHLLIEVANALEDHTRNTDIVARMGGDEFCVLLVETGKENAILVYNKLEKYILDIMKKNNWPVTMSTGIVTFHEQPETVKEMIAEADAIMYKVKHGGKNKLIHKDYGEIKTRSLLSNINLKLKKTKK